MASARENEQTFARRQGRDGVATGVIAPPIKNFTEFECAFHFPRLHYDPLGSPLRIPPLTPMKTLPLFILLALFAGRAAAKELVQLNDLKLEDGTTLKNAVVLKVEPDGLRLEHSAGVSKVKFEDLPAAVQKQFTFDREQAEDFRQKQEASREARAEAERRERVEQVLQQRREEQDADVMRSREAFFKLMASDEYSFPKLDKLMVDSIAIFKEAGRDDLAGVLEEDRKMLREHEVARPGEKYRRERDQLQARIRDLENQVAQMSSRPPDVRIVRDGEVFPIFVDRPVVIDRPVIVNRPAGQPTTCPPSRSFPVAPQFAPPAATPRPVMPATVPAMPTSGAQQHGAHLWKK